MMVKRIIIPAVIMVLVLTACVLIIDRKSGAENIHVQKPVPVETAVVERGDMVTGLCYSGTVRDGFSAMLSSRVSAEIMELFVSEGDQVTRGTVLAELNHRDPDLKLESLRARLDAATINAGYCSDTLEKYSILLDGGAISEQQYNEADLKYRLARAEVQSVKANIKELEAALDSYYIKAPRDGIVTGVMAQQGDMSMPGKALIAFSGGKEKKVIVSVVQEDLYSLNGNTPAVVTWSHESIQTRVSRIFPSIDPATNTATVEVFCESDKLTPGMAVEVNFVTSSKKDVLLVPSEAVLDTDGGTFVYVVEGSTSLLTQITAGAENDGFTEVISGLEEGRRIACGDLSRLEDNGSVYVVGGERP